ncbi:MAG: glutaredoxin domain-containing protein [Candidatus Pacebacteria bacterium]|nr:glutaredoxin domain-containing protein [Candidatus Paceibacterota bacterium]
MNIKVYSTEFCPYCVALKEFLKEQKITFEAIDVTENQKAQEEMIEKSGQMGVPVVDIDGEIIIGFDREKILQLLDIKS